MGVARRRLRRAALGTILLLGGGLAAVQGCGTAILNGLSSDAVYRRAEPQAYGPHPRQVLDVYRPRGATGPAPVVLFFYGGGWTEGARRDYEFVASSLAREGYLVVIPDYRLFPEVTFPGFAEDAAAAAAWVQRNVARHGGDPDRIFVMGHSAGAHLGALVVLWPELVEAAGGDPAGFAGFVGLAGPYDFLPLDEGSELERIFPEEARAASQPVHHVATDRSPPPVLLLHGTDDERVWPRNSRRLAARLQERRADVTLKTYDGVGHVRIMAALSAPLSALGDVRRDVIRWMDAHAGRDGGAGREGLRRAPTLR